MPIDVPEVPKLSIEALQVALPALVGSAGVRQTAPNFAANLLASPRSLSSPDLSYPVYTLGLADIVSEADLQKAQLSSWRHEFSSGDEVVAAEVSAGQNPRFSGINVNSRFRSVQQELRSSAEADKDFAARSYELRLLQISALGVRALWLTPKSHSQADVVIPLEPTRGELTAKRHYSPAEFIAALKSAAEVILRDDAPGKGS